MDAAMRALAARVERGSEVSERLLAGATSIVVGQRALLEGIVVGLLAGGHVLLEGVPGLAKTLAVRTVAALLDCSFRRIQFTPDLLPADVVGTQVWDPDARRFEPKPGPVFANVVLADEVNRAPAKVQSALLEAMQERQVTIGDRSFPLPEPFAVLATQNPVEQEGTYPLPEAQVDRFLLKLQVGYPPREDERGLLDRPPEEPELPSPIAGPEELLAARALVREVWMDPRVKDYVVDLVLATREPASHGLPALAPLVRWGASPRATLHLALAARARAFLARRAYATPDDVKAAAPDVLRHRISLTWEAEADGATADRVIAEVLGGVPVP
jgi:MoxR-like ATPase